MSNQPVQLPDFGGMISEMNSISRRKANPAEFMHERLMSMLEAHQNMLTENEELGVYVVGGSAPSFHLRSITYSNPDILRFIGKDGNGNAVQLVQHYSQMGVMIVSVPKLEEKVYRIGFNPPKK